MITLLLSLLILVSGNDGGVTKRTLLGLFSTDQKQRRKRKISKQKPKLSKENFAFARYVWTLKIHLH